MKTSRRVFWAAALSALAAGWTLTGSRVDVVIPQGQSTGDAARLLKKEGVIRFPRFFRLAAKAVHYDRGIRAGTYHLRRRMGSVPALWKLTHSRPDAVRVVIPEGFSARQIAERLEANEIATAQAFMAYVSANHLEGYLFPSTYLLMPNSPAEAVAHRMHQEFTRSVEPEFKRLAPSKLGKDKVVILASIVQREAVLGREQPMIAAVYLNRLAKRMHLDADPTVQYALGYWKKALSLDDLRVDSPYNTYAHFGLPPTPICSPGLDALRAVLEPAKTDALYFVADNSGGHAFSSTYEDHLKAKRRAKRERRLNKA